MWKSYVGVWTICLALFNAVAFLTPIEVKNGFWVGYAFITLAFAGQLYCTGIAFRAENKQTFFYRFSLISISFMDTLIMLAAGGLTMVVPAIPMWIGVVLCLAVLAFSTIAVINASGAVGMVSETDKKIQTTTLFVKMLMADAQVLMLKAKSEEARAITQHVCETIRYMT